MSKRQRLLASAMRKLIAQRHEWDGPYIDVHTDSMCVDGWVKLTEQEVRVINEVWEETRE